MITHEEIRRVLDYGEDASARTTVLVEDIGTSPNLAAEQFLGKT